MNENIDDDDDDDDEKIVPFRVHDNR